MKDPYFIYFLDLVFLLIIVLSFVVINYQIHINNDIKNKNQIKDSLFNILITIFAVFFVITFLLFGSKYGLKRAFIIWCILNIITPIPESGLMVSLPLNKFFDINLIVSQIYITLVSIIVIFITYNAKLYNSFHIGKYFNKLINKKRLLILLSIVSSFIGLIILQKEIDFYYKDIKMTNFAPLLVSYIVIVTIFARITYKFK